MFKNLRFFELVLFLALNLPHSLLSQNSRLYMTNHGLSSSRVNSIYEDKDGIIWVGGESGLDRIIGNHIKNFNSSVENRSSLSNNSITDIFMDSQKRLWVGTMNGLNTFESNKNYFKQVSLSNPEKSNSGFTITCIREYCKSNSILISTSGHGIFVVNPTNNQVDSVKSQKLNKLTGSLFIDKLLVDSQNRLWVSTGNSGIKVIDLNTMKRVELEMDSETAKAFSNDYFSCLELDDKTKNVLLGSSSRGLYIFDYSKQVLRKINDPFLSKLNLQSILVKKNGTILIGTESNGVWQLNRNTEKIGRIFTQNNAIADINNSKVHALLEDKSGNIWLGLYQKGLLIIPNDNSGFEYYKFSKSNSFANTASVSGFARINNQDLFVATDGAGIFRTKGLNLNESRENNEGLTSQSIICMKSDKNGNVWAGSYGEGLFFSDGGAFSKPGFTKNLSNNKVMCLEYDSLRNYLYVGTNGGFFDIIDITSKQLIHVNAEADKYVRALHLDKYGRLWIGTIAGTHCFDVDHRRIITENISINNLFSSKYFEENGDNLYISSNKGIVEYDMASNTYRIINLEKNNKNKFSGIMSLACVDDGSLWFTTPRYLSRLNLKTGHIRTFSSFDGFLIGEFRFGSVYKDPFGMLYFGGDNGVVKVNPQMFNKQSKLILPVYFTELNINNNLVDYDSYLKSSNVLDSSLYNSRRLKLKYKDNSFTISFSSLEYASPEIVNYSYRLTGFDKNWHYTDASFSKATYTSLPPGKYLFEVKGFYDEESNDVAYRSLKIIILNPWYSSWVARILYFLLILTILYLSHLFYQNKQKQRKILEVSQYNEQAKEDKLKLFTGIAHEFKTPLTLIINPLKKLRNEVTDTGTSELYDLMYRSSLRILKTVNQLLDIRRLDSRQFVLHFEKQDLIRVIKSVMTSFKNLTMVKQVSFMLETDNCEQLDIWIDSNNFDKIIYNILSNAFKFVPTGGKISIRVSRSNNYGEINNSLVNEFAEIKIFNNGPNIDKVDLNRLFEPFYQGKSSYEGSGIGLHLTHELVLLHHGSIEVNNIDKEGVEFIVRIPLGYTHLKAEELVYEKTKTDSEQLIENDSDLENNEELVNIIPQLDSKTEKKQSKNKNTILIADDDVELCSYLKLELSEYNVIISNSGNEAWDKLLISRPDIVVTDLLMPDGSGQDLCKRIKSNPETEYIPVIILTSESSESIQMESMQINADRFLTKPFSTLILKEAIEQALRVRERIKNRVQRTEMGFNYDLVSINSADDKLVKKATEYIKSRIEDSSLSIEDLSKHIGISRVHLNRKLKDILGLSPSNLVKTIRLKQAAYLLVNNNVNISEVAYKVGFASPSYFTFSFHEFFGMSPKEFIIYYSENADNESLQKLLEF